MQGFLIGKTPSLIALPKLTNGQRYSSDHENFKLFQTPPIPSWEELSLQKSEALRSMSEFHDGSWRCEDGATSCDVSGGSIMCSPPFRVSTSTRLGVAARGGQELKLVEIMSWDQSKSGEKDEGTDEVLCARTSVLGSCADIDSVDGSYSLHTFRQLDAYDDDELEAQNGICTAVLPHSISGVDPNRVSSIIESCLVANQSERVRCFMIYGKAQSVANSNTDDNLEEQRLLRVVVSHEKKVKSDDVLQGVVQESARSGEDNRLRELLSSEIYNPQKDLGENVKVPINMMLLSMGPWLGDTIIRDKSYNMLLPKSKNASKTSKGFGKSSSSVSKSRGESGFGDWVLGVQKSVITFKYDFDCNCRQMVDYGKYIGVQVEGWPRQSFGIIYDDRMSRRIKPEDRSCYIDFDNGAYCGFIFGSVFVKVR